jgi:sugar phosphate isomerase/epimerase
MAIKLGYQTLSWFWYPDEFTVFQTIEEVRLAGYGAVEFNDDLKRLRSPEEVARDLKQLNMECAGLCSMEHMIAVKQQMADWKNRIAFAAKLGVRAIPVSLGWRDTGEIINEAAYKGLAKNLEELAGEAAKYDMVVAYSPRYATLVENSRDLENLRPYLKTVKLCADMVNIAVTGDDPVAFVQKYRDDIVYARIGDWRIHKTVPLGTGLPLRRHQGWSGTESTEVEREAPVDPTLDSTRFLAALEGIGYDGHVIVAQGTTDPEYTPQRAASISRDYLRRIGY